MKQWQGIYEFAAVAQRLSFKLAAEELTLSSAQISRQISALEQRLGVKLLYRSTRQVTLTESGALFYDYCRQIIAQIDEAEWAVSQQQKQPLGLLRVTAPMAYGEQVISPLLNTFVARNPAVSLWLQFSNQEVDLVRERIDLAIRIGRLNDSSLIARRLAQRSLHLVASPEYLSRHGTPHSLEALAGHQTLTRFNKFWRLQCHGKEQHYKAASRISSDSGHALLNAALQGLGIAQLPNYYLDAHLASGALVTVLDQHRPEADGIWAIYPHNRQLSPKVKCAVEFLSEQLKHQQ